MNVVGLMQAESLSGDGWLFELYSISNILFYEVRLLAQPHLDRFNKVHLAYISSPLHVCTCILVTLINWPCSPRSLLSELCPCSHLEFFLLFMRLPVNPHSTGEVKKSERKGVCYFFRKKKERKKLKLRIR